jgi:hypothetical protein
MNTLSISEVIQWLRQQATELNKQADSLEQFMGSRGIMNGIAAPPNFARPDVTVSDVVAVLRKKGAGRAWDIAKVLKTTKEHVSEIVRDNPNMFEIRQRGWIKVLHENGNGTS